MLKRAKRLLTSRTTVLGLLLVMTAGMLAAAFIPQVPLDPVDGSVGPAAAAARPAVLQFLGLGNVFSTWWFAAIAFLFVTSLILSTWDQLRAAQARLRTVPAGGPGAVPCALPRAEVEAVLSREGYRRLAAVPGRTRHVKFWIGYWGAFLLHAGMSVTALFALVYLLTEHRVTLLAVSGPGAPLDDANSRTRRGLLGGTFALPSRVTLLSVEPTFWENDDLQDLGSQVILADRSGEARYLRVALNDYQHLGGLVVYQVSRFGNTFELQFTGGPTGELEHLLQLPYPAGRAAAGYGAFQLGDGGPSVKAKYYASADRQSLRPGDPQLVLRLQDGDAVLAEASLRRGETARLGPYQVHLASVGWWTVLLLEGSLGTSGIFGGFALLLLGGAITFASAPREAVVEDGPGGCTISWRPGRFQDFHREEGERILARCRGEPVS